MFKTPYILLTAAAFAFSTAHAQDPDALDGLEADVADAPESLDNAQASAQGDTEASAEAGTNPDASGEADSQGELSLSEQASKQAYEASAQGLDTARQAHEDGKAFGRGQAEAARDRRPEGARRPDDAGRPDDARRPDDAARPDGAGRPYRARRPDAGGHGDR